MSYQQRTTDVAKGKWRGILQTLGVDPKLLTGKHAPCPFCPSKDNFRFDNKAGSGSWICTCGAGHGMEFALRFTGRDFRDLAREIDQIVGNVRVEPAPHDVDQAEIQRLLRETYGQTVPVKKGDLVDLYLSGRGIDEVVYPRALRFGESLRDGEGGIRPCMVALVGLPGAAKFSTMHRTFLRFDGRAKADDMPGGARKLMKGTLPDGACVELGDYVAGGPLGIAEGIETALSASALYELPVWSALTANNLTKWTPPAGCSEVAVFGDNDASFTGQAAAYGLSRRLKAKGLQVTVHIPDQVGRDWNDVHMARHGLT